MPLLSRLAVQAARAYGMLARVGAPTNVSADYLVVAGGGSGGSGTAGGGGAGGLRTSAGPSGGGASAEPIITLSTLNTYSIVVGAGGAGGTTPSVATNNGSNSAISGTGLTTITSIGGGNGAGTQGGSSRAPGNGGSGGGGAADGFVVAPGTGTAGQGFAGGTTTSTPQAGGAGGGGAGAVGGSTSNQVGANGGAGVASSISGSSVTYGGGGAGAAQTGGTAGTGGAGGGGNGAVGGGSGTSGTANTGGGGGGSWNWSGSGFGSGGSGIVIISYTSATPKFVGGTITTSGGKQIHTFTSSGTLSPITPITASYLVVAGGGGGGTPNSSIYYAGGGGGGGLLTSSTTLYSGATYVVTVGAGGAVNTNGSDSIVSGTGLTTLTSTGGGKGGAFQTNGTAGGSGGGAGGDGSGVARTGGTGTSGQGNNGGGGGAAFGSTNTGAGGGGGAGAAGTTSSTKNGAAGGAGLANSLSGSSVTYAAGGGGQRGSDGTDGTDGANGTGWVSAPNLGHGGAASVQRAGSSGIVIISYAGSQVFNGGLVTSSGGNTIHTFTATGALTPLTNNLNNSLRFRSSASAYLNRTPTVAGNQQKFTWSGWVKIGYYTVGYLQAADGNSGNAMTSWYMRGLGSTGTLEFEHFNGTTTYNLTTSAVFRDPSAWYHITVAVDTTQATSADRTKIYVNGNQQTVTGTYVPQNTSLYVNGTTIQAIGSRKNITSGYGNYFDGYMTDINFIDGQQLEPYYFGNNDANGVWKPIQYKGTYGTNGFYLTFGNTTSTTTLGYDSSPNGNNWTCNNISLTAGTTYDAMTDVPTNTSATVANYAVLNPIYSTVYTGSVLAANLQINSPTTDGFCPSTIAVSSGKWYYEATMTNSTAASFIYGIVKTTAAQTELRNVGTGNGYSYLAATGVKSDGSGGAGTAYGATFTTNDVMGCAFDLDSGSITFYKNGVSQGVAYTGISGEFMAAIGDAASGSGGQTAAVNFGQRPFTYTPPTGFVALNTYNLPTPTILQGNKYMDATLWTGTGSSQVIVNQAQFKPDFVWVKQRSSTENHQLVDTVRGYDKYLNSNLTDAEATNTNRVTSFNSNGFSIGTATSVNSNTNTYVGWQWQAGQGTTSSNTSGSITSTVSVNTSAGFSVVTYTGNNTLSTIGHGLGAAPKFIIVKTRSGTDGWVCYHASLGVQYYTFLNTTAASYNNLANYWGSTAPSSTTFSINAYGGVNTNGATYVAYCWAEIAGFSKFGSYTGNSSADGAFVYTGFRPRYLMLKRTDTAGYDWFVLDSARNTYNAVNNYLYPDLSNAEGSAFTVCDFLSNGFKFRDNRADWNGSGATYIFMAFAENPFKNANAR